MGAISELHSFNTLALRPSGPGALCIFKSFNSLRTPGGTTVISPIRVNGLVPLHGTSESDSRVKADSNCLLAHLSQRLIGELIVYPWSGVRRTSSSVVRPSVRPSTMLKHLLLRNRLANQSQILCGASLGRGNNILFAASRSHDQDGRHAHIW